MRIVVIGNYAQSLITFRGALLEALVKFGHDVVACAPEYDADVVQVLRDLGVRYEPIVLSRTGINPLKNAYSFYKFVCVLRRLKPDVVFNYTIKPVIYGSLAARVVGVGAIFSMITGLGYVFIGDSRRQRLIRFVVCNLYRRALHCNKAVFFQNPDDLSLFKSHGLLGDENKAVLVNGSGVDLLRFCATSPKVVKPVFLLIARLIRDKGIYEFVEAARNLKAQFPHASFRLLGPIDSNPTAIPIEQVLRWQDEDIITYLGETHDVRPFIYDANVYVLPSYREGTPRTVLEAMAMGRAIITTDAPGCRETVIEGENGFLVPVKSVEKLAAAMEKFILDPTLMSRMGIRSREIAEEKYDVHLVNRTILGAMDLPHCAPSTA